MHDPEPGASTGPRPSRLLVQLSPARWRAVDLDEIYLEEADGDDCRVRLRLEHPLTDVRRLDRLSRDPEMRRLLAQEQLILEVSESILEEMERLDVMQAELAKRLGKTRGFVSQLLSGERNMTLRTLGDLCRGLGLTPSLELAPVAAESLSFSMPDGEES